MVADDCGALDSGAADIQQRSGLALGGCLNWSMLVRPLWQLGQPCRDHGPLTFGQVPPLQVQADHICQGAGLRLGKCLN